MRFFQGTEICELMQEELDALPEFSTNKPPDMSEEGFTWKVNRAIRRVQGEFQLITERDMWEVHRSRGFVRRAIVIDTFQVKLVDAKRHHYNALDEVCAATITGEALFPLESVYSVLTQLDEDRKTLQQYQQRTAELTQWLTQTKQVLTESKEHMESLIIDNEAKEARIQELEDLLGYHDADEVLEEHAGREVDGGAG